MRRTRTRVAASTIGFWYRQPTDAPPGWSHLLEHLLDQAFQNEFQEALDLFRKAGGQHLGLCTPDGVAFLYHGDESFHQGLVEMERRRLDIPIDGELFRREMTVVTNEIRAFQDSDAFRTQRDAIGHLLWPKYSAYPAVGAVPFLESATLRDIIALRDWIKADGYLTVSPSRPQGDVGPQRTRDSGLQYRGVLPPRPTLPPGVSAAVFPIGMLPILCVLVERYGAKNWTFGAPQAESAKAERLSKVSFYCCAGECVLLVRDLDISLFTQMRIDDLELAVSRLDRKFRSATRDSLSNVFWTGFLLVAGYEAGLEGLRRGIRNPDVPLQCGSVLFRVATQASAEFTAEAGTNQLG